MGEEKTRKKGEKQPSSQPSGCARTKLRGPRVQGAGAVGFPCSSRGRGRGPAGGAGAGPRTGGGVRAGEMGFPCCSRGRGRGPGAGSGQERWASPAAAGGGAGGRGAPTTGAGAGAGAGGEGAGAAARGAAWAQGQRLVPGSKDAARGRPGQGLTTPRPIIDFTGYFGPSYRRV